MAYSFLVNENVCINCGICMDLCPVRCLDMTRSSEAGELARADQRRSPIPVDMGERPWMMLTPVQVGTCIGCSVCAQECPTNAITIEGGIPVAAIPYARRGPVAAPPQTDAGWHTLNEYTRAVPDEPGEAPWGDDHGWQIAGREATWQTWRSWLGERKEHLRAPCQAACPVGTNAGLYVSLIAEGRYDEALRVAAEPNPFPSICGRVCTAPCEDVCRRGEFDAPIAIRDLKRFATDQGSPWKRPVTPPTKRYAQSVGIVGAGPTGLSAAFYLARRGYPVTVYDALPVAGGMMAIGIPEYRLPRVELNRDIDAMRDLGVTFRLNTPIGDEFGLDDLQRQHEAVLLAVGAQRSQQLGITGESLEGVTPATSFLKQYNLDPDTRLHGAVAVIGGGSTALDAARSALRAGASSVQILYRRTQAEMPAQGEEVRAALEEGIEVLELVAPISFTGANGRLTTITCQRMQTGERDEKGRQRVTPIPDSDFMLSVDMALIAIGEAPDPSFLPLDSRVEVADWGGLLVNSETLATRAAGVFAAGDVTYGPRSIIHAAAHGRKAASSIHAYLQGKSPREVTEAPDDAEDILSTLPAEGHVTLDLRPTPRAVMPLRVVGKGVVPSSSAEFATGFTEEQAQAEAKRCLRCDLAYLCPSFRLVGGHPDAVRQPVEAPAARH